MTAPTPRTDKEARKIDTHGYRGHVVPADFARQLERELAIVSDLEAAHAEQLATLARERDEAQAKLGAVKEVLMKAAMRDDAIGEVVRAAMREYIA